jgi:protocatechuate 3,4-dioxygenase beta subunit
MLEKLKTLSWQQIGRLAAGGLLAAALAACGGGGGSPGAVPGGADAGKTPASVSLVASSSTIAASGADGTEVTLTAIVKDANNSALAGVTVSFKADSGTISNTVRVSDANGMVVEKLSVKGDPTPRDITITASAGSATSPAKKVTVIGASSTPKLLLTSSSGTLPSSGAPGTAVQIRALVLDSNNVVVPDAPVNFSTDSGALSAAQIRTDKVGVAIVTLDTGTDPSTRAITVSATVAGTPASTVKVNVAGTKLTINAVGTVNAGATSDLTVVVVDSAGTPLANRTVTFSALFNTLVSKSGGTSSALTDSAGKVTLSYTAKTAANDVVTVRALGETAVAPIVVSTSNFTIAVVDDSGATRAIADTDFCNRVKISNFVGATAQDGTVSVSSSRGSIYTDASCQVPFNAPINLVAGAAQVYVKANSPGFATLTANSSATGSTVQTSVEFVAPLTSGAVLSLQATPAVVGANAPGSTSEQVTLRAVVTDKASQGNPVKNAKVSFSIVSDSSGGTLSQPSEVMTGSDGSATVSYVAGTTATATDGVVIQARVISPVSAATNTTRLTVAQKSLFISAGTGNSILSPTSNTYQVDYVVFVTDSAGNAVRDVAITGSVRPRNYRKGIMVLPAPDKGPWMPQVSATCLNEDLDSDGVLGIGEDKNGNGRLDPVIPMNITSSGKTAANGTATISMIYPKDRAYWLDVDFTIRGAVAGSEARYVGYTVLPGAASDYASPTASPPGSESPYGISGVCTDAN